MANKFPEIGDEGIMLETVDAGKTGKAFFKGYGIVEVYAREQLRERSHVLIIDGKRGAREGSPEEIKYRDTTTEEFRNVETDTPFPVTHKHNVITSVSFIIVAAGNTLLVAPGAAGNKIRVHYFSYSNRHAAAADVGMRFTATGAITHRFNLAAGGGNVNANLIDAAWEGGANESLFLAAAGAYAGGVLVTVGYTEVPA